MPTKRSENQIELKNGTWSPICRDLVTRGTNSLFAYLVNVCRVLRHSMIKIGNWKYIGASISYILGVLAKSEAKMRGFIRFLQQNKTTENLQKS